jgi:hypothetical protein
VLAALAAVVAVLGATAGLDAEQRALLHHARVVVHAVHLRGAVHEVQERHLVDGLDLVSPAQWYCR